VFNLRHYSTDLGWDTPKKTVVKGMRCVRRDTIGHTRDCQSSIVKLITNNRIADAIEEGRQAVTALFAGKVPFADLVTSKKVSSRYRIVSTTTTGEKVKVECTPHGKWKALDGSAEGYCVVVPGESWVMKSIDESTYGSLTLTHPHVHVMHRMEQRTPGAGPRVGDRIKYVYLQPSRADIDADTLQIGRADDPVWAEENNKALDALFYFEHSVRSPLEAVLEVFVTSPYAALGWQSAQSEAMNKARGQSSLASTFGFGFAAGVTKTSKIARVPKRKAQPPPVVVTKNIAGGIGSFFTKK